MKPNTPSLKAYLRGGVAALTMATVTITPMLASAQTYQSFHGEKVVKSDRRGLPPSRPSGPGAAWR